MDADKLVYLKRSNYLGLTSKDYLIICGDTGITWNIPFREEILRVLFDEFPCTVLFVDGNHENFDILNSYPISVWNNGKVHFISSNVIHLLRGQVFDINGFKIFSFGGAKSTDRASSSEFWWKEELPSDLEYSEGLENLYKYRNSVDLIVSHDGPEFILKRLKIPKRSQSPQMTSYFSYLYQNVKFSNWVFGHHHVDANYDKYFCMFNRIMKIL